MRTHPRRFLPSNTLDFSPDGQDPHPRNPPQPRPELQAAGIAHLRLFGSVARGEATPQSDIDLMADYDPNKRITLLTLGGFQVRLSDLLGTEVDLANAKLLKPQVREHAMRDAVDVF